MYTPDQLDSASSCTGIDVITADCRLIAEKWFTANQVVDLNVVVLAKLLVALPEGVTQAPSD